MRPSPPDRSTIEGSRSSWDPSFSYRDLRKLFKIHPAYIPRAATYDGIRLHLAT
jgi:hypothetical protein